MDVCSHSTLLVSEDLSSFHELCVDALKSARRVVVDSSIDDIGNSLTEYLSIQDDKEFVSSSILPPVTVEDVQRDLNLKPHQNISLEKCLRKSATFPSSSRNMSSSAVPLGGKHKGDTKGGKVDITNGISPQNENAKSVISSYPRSISLPTPSKLVSAMKGSREKQGVPPKKLSVKWAPDVYDPIPTAVSHMVSNKPQRHNKKNAKNKQKAGSKNSRGSKSKDKKQARIHGGSSSKGGFKMMDYNENVVVFAEPPHPDPHCGSSFLKKSVTSLHFSVTEAT